MKKLKTFADGEISLLIIIFIVTLVSLLLLGTLGSAQTVQVRTVNELKDAITAKYDIRIMTDSIDLTGVILPPIESVINGTGKKILCNKLPVSGEVFMFNLNGGTIDSLTIIGPNGNVFADGGYFGGIKVYEKGGNISNVNFINCDKFGIYNQGNKLITTDTCRITNCTFTNIKRLGYGYGIWTQYSHSKVRNCVFQQGRHAFDCSSSNWSYDIQYCTFTGSFYNYQMHNHAYTTVNGIAYSGNGLLFMNNYIFGTQVPLELYKSETAKTLIKDNYFEAYSDLGKISGTPIVEESQIWINNKTFGVDMLSFPLIMATDTVMVGGKIEFTNTNNISTVYPLGKPSGNGYASPRVKVFSAYNVNKGRRSVTKYHTLTVRDTGLYTGFYLKTYKCRIEVYRDGNYIQTISSPKWVMCLYRTGKLTFKVVGEPGAALMIDDWVKNGGSETFEISNKIKIYGYNGTVKASRFSGDQSSGIYSFKFEFVTSGSVKFE